MTNQVTTKSFLSKSKLSYEIGRENKSIKTRFWPVEAVVVSNVDDVHAKVDVWRRLSVR